MGLCNHIRLALLSLSLSLSLPPSPLSLQKRHGVVMDGLSFGGWMDDERGEGRERKSGQLLRDLRAAATATVCRRMGSDTEERERERDQRAEIFRPNNLWPPKLSSQRQQKSLSPPETESLCVRAFSSSHMERIASLEFSSPPFAVSLSLCGCCCCCTCFMGVLPR